MGADLSVEKYPTIPHRLWHFAEETPHRELFIFYRGETRSSLTARQLCTMGEIFAARLHEYGFRRHDTIVNTLPNSPERVITDVGIMMAGCISLNGQIMITDGEDFLQNARRSSAKAVILCNDYDSSAWLLLRPYIRDTTSSGLTALTCDRAPLMTSAILVTRDKHRNPLIQELKEEAEAIHESPHPHQWKWKEMNAPEDTLVVFTSSGSTGHSKLIPRTHAMVIDMVSHLRVNMDKYNIPSDAAVFTNRPLGWIGGFPFPTYCCGDKRVLLDNYYAEPDCSEMAESLKVWHAVSAEKCVMAVILPVEISNIARHLETNGGNSFRVKYLGFGGQPVRKTQIAKMYSLADTVSIGYASSEAGYIASAVLTRDSQYDEFFCGRPTNGAHVRVLDEDDQELPAGQVGRIHVKGPGVFKGYIYDPDEEQTDFENVFTPSGWYNTDDRGYLDAKGNVYVLGRAGDVIHFGATKLYPGWLEKKLLKHPDLAEVCIVPVSDPVFHHKICACVKLVPGSHMTENQLRDFSHSAFFHKERLFTPKPHFLLILQDFPMTKTGKPNRKAVLEIAEEKYGVKN